MRKKKMIKSNKKPVETKVGGARRGRTLAYLDLGRYDEI